MLSKIGAFVKSAIFKGVRSFNIERSKYEMLLNEASDAIYGVDFQGKITYANPSASVLFGYSQEEFEEKKIVSVDMRESTSGCATIRMPDVIASTNKILFMCAKVDSLTRG